MSGDARRALDICRRATELVGLSDNDKGLVTMTHVDAALQEMYSAPKIVAIRLVMCSYTNLNYLSLLSFDNSISISGCLVLVG